MVEHLARQEPDSLAPETPGFVKAPAEQALDNTEILFDRSLEVKPVSLLQSCCRNRTIVAAWTGAFSADTLSYANPGHPEFEQVRSPGAIILSLPLSRREARP